MNRGKDVSRQSSSRCGKVLKSSVFVAIVLLMVSLSLTTVMAMSAEEIQDRIDNAESGDTLNIRLNGIVKCDKPIEIDESLTICFSDGTFFGSSEKNTRVLDITGDKVNIELSNVKFFSQHSEKGGGHIRIDGKNVTIKGGSFIGGTSDDEGGSIYIDGKKAKIEDAYFLTCWTNDGEDGGAIYVADPYVTIKNCTFENCQAEGNGGAIALHPGINDYLEIEDCTFINCRAEGKGQWVYGAGDTKITNCTRPENDNSYNDCEIVSVAAEETKAADLPKAEVFAKANAETQEEAEFIEDNENGDAAAPEETVGEEAIEADAQDEEEVIEEAQDEEVQDEEEASENDEYDTGSVLSSGQIGIVIAVPVLAVIVIVALAVVRKKRKSEK